MHTLQEAPQSSSARQEPCHSAREDNEVHPPWASALLLGTADKVHLLAKQPCLGTAGELPPGVEPACCKAVGAPGGSLPAASLLLLHHEE